MAVGVDFLAQIGHGAGDFTPQVLVAHREDRALKGDAHRLTGYPLAALVLIVVASRLDLVHGMQQAARYHGLRHFEPDAHYSSTSHVIEFRSRPVTMRGLSA